VRDIIASWADSILANSTLRTHSMFEGGREEGWCLRICSCTFLTFTSPPPPPLPRCFPRYPQRQQSKPARLLYRCERL
jgi:hypothetical protein